MKVKVYLEVIKKLKENGVDLDFTMINDILEYEEDRVSLLSGIHKADNYFSISDMIGDISESVPKDKIREAVKIIDGCDDPKKVKLIADFYGYDWFNNLPNANEIITKLIKCKDAKTVEEAIRSIQHINGCLKRDIAAYNCSDLPLLFNQTAKTFSKCKGSDRAEKISTVITANNDSSYRKIYKIVTASEYIATTRSYSIANIIYDMIYQGDILNRYDYLEICKSIVNAKSYNRADAAATIACNRCVLRASNLHDFVKKAAYAKSEDHAMAYENIVSQNTKLLNYDDEDKFLTIFKIVSKVEDPKLLNALSIANGLGEAILDWLPLVSEEQLENDSQYPNKYISFIIDKSGQAVNFDYLARVDIDAAIEGLEELTDINPNLDYKEPEDILVKVKKINKANNSGE